MPGRPMLLHRMALVSFRLFCKNLGNSHEFFGQMVYPPPLAENSANNSETGGPKDLRLGQIV